MSTAKQLPEPWHSFFRELDELIDAPVRLECIGGFVVTQLHGLERPTADVDVIELAPRRQSQRLMELAGRGGSLYRKYGIYLDQVTVAVIPENYEERLVEIVPGTYKHLTLMALDPYDIALSKLERNSQKDRDDVRFLARTVPFDLKMLEARYNRELRWQLGRPDREDLTMQFWIEMLMELKQ
jgi:hypothetical protein